jgi:hypothetical protein
MKLAGSRLMCAQCYAVKCNLSAALTKLWAVNIRLWRGREISVCRERVH